MAACSDLFVLDFSTLLPGPLATLMLAELGAEVVKIERPETGDEMRGFEPRWGEDAVNFVLLNRGKKSIAIDLKDARANQLLRPLIERADIIVEQFRPGVMARLGLGYEDVRRIRPDIIYCSITGYGQTGPRHVEAGHDLNYQARTGMLALSHGAADAAVVPPVLVADIAGGSYPALINILAALRERDRGGGGCHLDIAMSDNLFPLMYWAQGNGTAAGRWPTNGGDLVTGGSPRYRLYRTADGAMLAAAPLEDRFWTRFCDAVGLDDRWRDPTADPVATSAAVAAIIGARPAAYWRSLFATVECCCCILESLETAMADPGFIARGLFEPGVIRGGGERIPALPLALDPALRAPPGDRAAPPLGADNAAYLR